MQISVLAQCEFCVQNACHDRHGCCDADGATTYLDMINNKDVGADCDPATKQCNIQIQDFPLQLQTPCTAGDCISDKNPTLNQGEPMQHAPSPLVSYRASFS